MSQRDKYKREKTNAELMELYAHKPKIFKRYSDELESWKAPPEFQENPKN